MREINDCRLCIHCGRWAEDADMKDAFLIICDNPGDGFTEPVEYEYNLDDFFSHCPNYEIGGPLRRAIKKIREEKHANTKES